VNLLRSMCKLNSTASASQLHANIQLLPKTQRHRHRGTDTGGRVRAKTVHTRLVPCTVYVNSGLHSGDVELDALVFYSYKATTAWSTFNPHSFDS
jgi:hypothetical protein